MESANERRREKSLEDANMATGGDSEAGVAKERGRKAGRQVEDRVETQREKEKGAGDTCC